MSPSGLYDRLIVMSHTITLDTLEYANQLKSVGVPDKQSEMQAMLEKKQTDTFNELLDEKFATKIDLKLMESRLIIRLSSIMATMLIIGLSLLGYFLKH